MKIQGRNVMIIWGFVVVLTTTCKCAHGEIANEDPWQELQNIVKAYAPAGGIDYKGTMYLIDDNDDHEKIIETQTFEYALSNNNYQYRIGAMEMIKNNTWMIAVNHSYKTISVAHKKSGGFASSAPFDINTFKKVMKEKNARIRITNSEREKILTIDSISDPGIQGYEIYYSPKTYRVTRMVIGMARIAPLDDNEKSIDKSDNEGIQGYYYYLDVKFSSVTGLNSGELGFSPERKYIMVVNNQIFLTRAYKNYELNMQTEP